jgi:hypothetical protein
VGQIEVLQNTLDKRFRFRCANAIQRPGC